MTRPPSDVPGAESRRGEVVLDPLTISAEDRAFLLGDGLFETIRVYRGRPFRLSAHLERLERGMDRIGLQLAEIDFLRERLGEALSRGPDEAALRITVSRGVGGGPAGEGATNPTVAIRVIPVQRQTRALHAVLEGWIHEAALTAGLKITGYLERIVALRRARARGAHEALIRNSRGEVVEGSTSNVVGVDRTGVLLAPGAAQGVLSGITLGVVLGAARDAGIVVEERGIRPDEIPALRELFLTSSIRELAPVVEVEGDPVGSGEPGPVFIALRRAFREVVAAEVEDP